MKYKICVEGEYSLANEWNEAGMNEHIAKPVDAELLKKKIAEYCR